MTNIEQGRPIEFIRHRRESGGYHKVLNDDRWGGTHCQLRGLTQSGINGINSHNNNNRSENEYNIQ